MQFNLEDFINKVPVLGALYSLLTSEAVIASIAGVLAAWFTTVEAEQPVLALLISAITLVIVSVRMNRDKRVAELKQVLITNQGTYTAIVERLLGTVRFKINVGGREFVIDVPDDQESAIAAVLVGLGISLIPGESPQPTSQMAAFSRKS